MVKQSAFFLTFILIAAFACNSKNTSPDKSSEAEPSEASMKKATKENSMYLLVGTYTKAESKGIYVYYLDTISGHAEQLSMVKVENPSYLTLSHDEHYVYSVTENDDDTACANSFLFDKKAGVLHMVNSQLTGGGAPCYIIADRHNKHIITANYVGGNLTVFETEEDGRLTTASAVIEFEGQSVNEKRQEQPHLHSVHFSPDGKYLFATDLGTDRIYKFVVNENNEDSENYIHVGRPAFFKLREGSGPRHFEFHPNGKFVYLINELSDNVMAFTYDSEGNWNEIQEIEANPRDAEGGGDIHVSPDGKFLYTSLRIENDGITIYSIDPDSGKLTKAGYQHTVDHPRNFVITPNGRLLLVAGRDDNCIEVYKRDMKTGLLEKLDRDIPLDMPVCLKLASMD